MANFVNGHATGSIGGEAEFSAEAGATVLHPLAPAQTVRRSGQRGVEFRAPKLYVFRRGGIRVLKAWPDVRAWELNRQTAEWRGLRLVDLDIERQTDLVQEDLGQPDALPLLETDPSHDFPELSIPDLIRLRFRRRRQNAWRRWWSLCPMEIRKIVASYPPGPSQWRILQLLARGGGMHLAEQNPALALTLAFYPLLPGSWTEARQPWRSIRRLARRPQRDILAAIHFPATAWAVRVLRKIPANSFNSLPVYDICKLRELLNSAEQIPRMRKLLNHAAILPLERLPISDEYWMFIFSHSLLTELTTGLTYQEYLEQSLLLNDCRRLGLLFGFPARPFQSVTAMQSWHDRTVRRHHDHPSNRIPLDIEAIQFPAPPIPGTQWIVPLTDPAMLIQEGREMEQCVAAYIMDVAGGSRYVYRILAPTRSTLAIAPACDGSEWTVDQLRGFKNAPADEATRQTVRNWLASSQPDVRPGEIVKDIEASVEPDGQAPF